MLPLWPRHRAEATVSSERIDREMAEAEEKAWKALAHYKFWMFGYWCGIWVHLRRLSGRRDPNPWRELVEMARERTGEGKPTEEKGRGETDDQR